MYPSGTYRFSEVYLRQRPDRRLLRQRDGRLHPNYRHQCGLGKLSFTSTERLIPGFFAPTHLVTKDSLQVWQCEVTTLRHLGLEGLENYTDARCVGFRDNKGSVRC